LLRLLKTSSQEVRPKLRGLQRLQGSSAECQRWTLHEPVCPPITSCTEGKFIVVSMHRARIHRSPKGRRPAVHPKVAEAFWNTAGMACGGRFLTCSPSLSAAGAVGQTIQYRIDRLCLCLEHGCGRS
jgi:hypothetical protein